MIYMDNAATTFPKPEEVYLQMNKVNRELAVNAGRGSYSLARKAITLIDETREKLLNLVKGSQIADVVLTASATIALNEVIGGMAWEESDIAYISPFEHNAVMRTLYMMQSKYCFQIYELPLKPDLTIDLEKMNFEFSKNPPTKLLITHISNVTGYILPVKKICNMAKKYLSQTVVDASQSVGLLDIDLREIEADYLVFAGHKNLYGAFGIGGFYIKKGLQLKPYLAGGTGSDSLNLEMPQNSLSRYEPASHNIVAISGLNAAIDVINKNEGADEKSWAEQELKLCKLVRNEFEKINGVILYGPMVSDFIGIIAFNIKNYKASEVGLILDEDYDIAVRTGYHCAPLVHKYLKDESYSGVVRASIGRYTTEEDIKKMVAAVREISEG